MLLMRSRLAAGAALLVLLAAAPRTLNVWTAPAAVTPAGRGQSPPAEVAALYRLGTAGRPFGWSTAVGDFNADGRPDVIVADRASEWTRNGGYRLDFAISGEATASDSIEVPDEGVGIRVADVDHDSDLDIVLASTISGRTIGVWLNDGAGHFTRSPMPVAALTRVSAEAVDHGTRDGVSLSLDVPSRRVIAMAPVRARAPGPDASSTRLFARAFASVSLAIVSSAAPRAPPVLL